MNVLDKPLSLALGFTLATTDLTADECDAVLEGLKRSAVPTTAGELAVLVRSIINNVRESR